jgi:hypothetical protein
MPILTDDQDQTAAAIAGLTAALQRFEERYETSRRAERRLRIGLFLAVLVIVGGAAYFTVVGTGSLLAQFAPFRIAQSDPAAAQQRREQLLANLPDEERGRLQKFEAQVRLVRENVEVSPDFDSGAAVALVLSNMSRSVEVMPELNRAVAAMAADTRAISTCMGAIDQKMDALPVLATEVQQMRGQMAVMAAGMDSTIGRAGRMLPWNW